MLPSDISTSIRKLRPAKGFGIIGLGGNVGPSGKNPLSDIVFFAFLPFINCLPIAKIWTGYSALHVTLLTNAEHALQTLQ